ncbi:MAG: FAD-binding protein, partial [Firmicutes bacterium]|nr:FAD-binding protein [Bacillota bacterium]
MKRVLIIGSGIAGLSCAIECGRQGISTILASPYASERAQSVMAAGGINAAVEGSGDRAGDDDAGDSVQCHIDDTLKGGVYLDDEEAVKGLCSEAPEIVNWLEQIGVVFTRDEKGKVDRRAFGGQTYSRTAYSGAATGKQIVTALVRQSRRYESEGLLERKFGFHFHSALIKDGVCYGALLFDMRKRCLTPVYADAVVIATGGQNKLYGKTTGSRLCDGYAAGKLFEQGVRLKNLEFVQYHPTSIETPQKRMLISEAARGEGGRLYYVEEGRRVYFMEDKFGPKGNLMPRDVVSRHIYDAPSQVYLDIAFLGAQKIHTKLEEVYELCKGYIGLDVTK